MENIIFLQDFYNMESILGMNRRVNYILIFKVPPNTSSLEQQLPKPQLKRYLINNPSLDIPGIK